jgi:hypothetical protein
MAIYNIQTDYDWTSVPRRSPYRDIAPYIKIKSYKITSSAALNRIASYANLLNQNVEEFYDELYSNAMVEDTFFIPYFDDNVRSFSNEFGDTFQQSMFGGIDSTLNTLANEAAIFSEMRVGDNLTKIGKNIAGIANSVTTEGFGAAKNIGNIGKGVSTAPGSYIETPKLYAYAQNDSAIEVGFPLFNTINQNAYVENAKLIKHLTSINRPRRLTPVTMEPPRLYEIVLPGVRYMRWAFCSSFSLSLLGNRRIVDGTIIPDGYQVKMSFTSLVTEVNNFLDSSKIYSDGEGIPNWAEIEVPFDNSATQISNNTRMA